MNDSVLETTALQTLEAAELSIPVLTDFHNGIAMMEAGQAREAAVALARCVEQVPTFAAGHIVLGVALAVNCEVYPAIDHLQKATELAPDNFEAHFMLAKYYFTLRISNKGYASAACALACAKTRPQRLALSQLLQRERERERHGIVRPLFNRRFGLGFSLIAATGAAAFLCAVMLHIR